MTNPIQPHNAKAAATWSSPGRRYEEISRTISDGIEHAVSRLAVAQGERVLDAACGTGWASRSIATSVEGARVTGLDIASGLLEAARARANREGLSIDYVLGDAEKMPFPDCSFDAVISTFGVMFSPKPEAVAADLARVVRRGGRLALATWASEGTVLDLFKVMKPYLPPPLDPAPPSPFAWGDRERVKALLGSSFDLAFEEGITTFRIPDAERAWELYVETYGPTKVLAESLDGARRSALKEDMIAFMNRFRGSLGISLPREYLLTVGVRR
jgi:SAM-dependent methyltransferase